MIGGAQGLNMLIGMVRVKFVAILLGPIGVGLVATYQSIVQLVGTVAGLGLQSSAVRDIAQTVGKDDKEHLGRIVLSLRRMCWLTGGTGAVTLALLSPILSQVTFDSPEFSNNIALLGLTILFTNLKGGQMALIQGMRRISDLAKLNVIGVVIGTILSIVLYWFYGMDGIVPAIVLLSLSELCVSWLFARKVSVPKVSMTWVESFQVSGGMIKMGLAFMWNGLLIAIVAYCTRTLIAQEVDLLAVGIFSAAFALSGLIVNFVLGAMGADYYPSLTAIKDDHKKMTVLVNQQTEVGILLAIPGLLATISFAPWVINLFYTAEFIQSSELLRWFALGCIGRVISWPLGFIILAKGLSRLFVITETIINITHLVLIITMLDYFGIKGVAIAYPILYLIHIFMMLGVSKYLIGFSWSKEVWRMFGIFTPIVLGVFCSAMFLSIFTSSVIGVVVTIVVSTICFQNVLYRLGSEHKIHRVVNSAPLIKHILVRKNNKH